MAKQNSESEDDFIRMQQEAIRRVRDMQSRARATLENAGVHIENSDVGYSSAQAQNGPTQSDLFAQAFSETAHSGAAHSGAAHSDTAHSGAAHSGAAHSGAAHSDTAHSGAAHSDATHSDATHFGAAHSDATHFGAAHSDTAHSGAARENQRPAEKNESQQGEPPLMQALGLNLALDSDQLLLLLTIYLLIKDGADKWLILSLAYVMLT